MNRTSFSILLVSFFFVFALYVLIFGTTKSTTSIFSPLADRNSKVFPTYIVTPSPIPTHPPLSPTPTPLTGYCLTVPVLMYHHVQPMMEAIKNGQTSLTVDNGVFDNQMKYLSDSGYHSITAADLITALRQKSSLPPKSVVVTLDDGYADVYQNAFPSAQKYHIILNLMISTGLVNNPGYMTWDNIKQMVGTGSVQAYNHTWSHYSLSSGTQQKQETEILTAKQQLEQHLGKPDTILTYPYGTFNNTSVSILTKNGFVGAFSTMPGWIECDSILYSLHRQRVGSIPLSSYRL